ncbi:MAG TPA: glycosyltransferase family 2 protein [Tepidisphaeraceae bacterium]|nr:glycosyltransferase family 2 protein [Tepidisphaeraceae bacterium]
MKLLIAIPVFNERKMGTAVLDEVLRYHDDVLVIDDGSTDGTAELLSQRTDIKLLRHPVNLGYGKSLIDAFSYAHRRGYDWIITMDYDEQHEPAMIPVFKREIEKDDADVISGSRYLRSDDAVTLPPPERRAINHTITTLLNALFGWQLTDSFCGYKAHRVKPTVDLKLTETGYAFPLQLWPRVAAAGLRVRELPVKLIYNDPNRTFGSGLDDAQRRLKHYLNVLNSELQRDTIVPLRDASPAVDTGTAPPRSGACCRC